MSSSRPTAWDYNYDNWFYLSNDTAPTLDFTVASNSEDYGVSNVQYAIVTTNKTTMKSGLSGWTTLTADSNGKYHASLLGFRNAGLAGGTVVIKMTANNKVSYSPGSRGRGYRHGHQRLQSPGDGDHARR